MINFRLINMSQEPTSTRVNIRFTIALAVPAGKLNQIIFLEYLKTRKIFIFSI